MIQDHVSQTDPAAAPVRIRVLGRFAIEVNGRPLRFIGRGPHKPLEPARCRVDAFACDRALAETERLLGAAQTDAALAALVPALEGYRGP